MPISECGDSLLEKISIGDETDAYIMSTAWLERILFNRNLIGLEFTQACQNASEAFLRHFASEMSGIHDDDIAELVLLSKGVYYWMHNAFAAQFARNLAANFVATKRVAVAGTTAKIEIPYCDLSASADSLIVADTIATGATMVATLERYLDFHALRRVFVFSIAGSAVGGRVVGNFCRSRDVECTIVYGLAAFGLGSNGFDLSFLHPDTICLNAAYVARARSMFEGKPVSAVGWDFGSQAQSIRKYRMLCWIEAEYWNLQDSSALAIKEKPTDWQLVQKESAAYEARLPIGDKDAKRQ